MVCSAKIHMVLLKLCIMQYRKSLLLLRDQPATSQLGENYQPVRTNLFICSPFWKDILTVNHAILITPVPKCDPLS
jgi:hypothetical protein